MTPRTKMAVALPLVALAILLVVVANVTNWNALREPIAHAVHAKTHRTLRIGGDLDIGLRWPVVRVHASDVTFSNPSWASRPNMIDVRHATVDIAILPLFRGQIVFPQVQLDQAALAFEKSRDGRRNWLLDRRQRDSQARVAIRHLAVGDGRVEYDDPAQGTRLSARITTSHGSDKTSAPLRFTVQGRYKGEPLVAQGAGDTILALRDETRPYHLNVSGKIGQTAVGADGRITNLLKLSAVDLQIVLRGASLAQLYPLVGVVFPDTPPYRTRGRLVHGPRQWRYEKFTGEMGRSDIAGSLSIDTGGRRPLLVARLDSTRLDISNLGPLVGAGHAGEKPAAAKSVPTGILPGKAFRTERWNRMDADVTLDAGSIDRPAALPLHRLSTRLRLQDGRLRLDPLRFDVAGGTLAGAVTLDGRASPIQAAAKLLARTLQLAQLFPTLDRSMASIGEFNGNIDLKGQGDTVASMLGSANGQASLVIDGGEVSKLLMETMSLHLLEMLQLKVTGDEPVRIRCGIADFAVKQGVMQPDILVLDTDVSRIDGSGRIDLGQERLDLTVVPKSRKPSLVALRTPIHVQGSFAHPQASLDKGKLAMRGLGALALGAVNPALALLPLIDAGRNADSECRRLIGEVRTAGR
ncbi:AsmA family protein [Thiobacillus sp.]|uniref:AsmA family protein n=1 Tax=Thiobacillus sp. TaxID=924 RepID=UPI001AC0618E|nr:AsmA family protein [Thiobacillus sp.]MBN8778495.1 AsmA family protein [Thiobacillus sp.]